MDIPGLLRGRSILCILLLWVLQLHSGKSLNITYCPATGNTTDSDTQRFILRLTCNVESTTPDVKYQCTHSSIATETTEQPRSHTASATSSSTSSFSNSPFSSDRPPTHEDVANQVNDFQSAADLLLQKLETAQDPGLRTKFTKSLHKVLNSLSKDVLSKQSTNTIKQSSPEIQTEVLSKILGTYESIGPKLALQTAKGKQERKPYDNVDILLAHLQFTTDAFEASFKVDTDTLFLKSNITSQDLNGSDSVGLSVVVFKDPDALFNAEESGNKLKETGDLHPLSTSFHVSTNLMMVSLYSPSMSATPPVGVGIAFSANNASNWSVPSCVSLAPHTKEFKVDGCKAKVINSSSVKCVCNHLTTFAVLMSVMAETDDQSDVSDTLSFVFIIPGLIFLLLSFITFVSFKRLQSDRNTIHTHLSVTLGLAQLLFIIGIDYTEHQVACAVIAGFLHYMFLAAFFWMLVEGLHIYVKLVLIFEKAWSFIPLFIGIGYGTPLVIVVVSAIIFHEGYGSIDACWLSRERGFMWSFVGPVIAIIAVNLVMLCIAMHTMILHYRSPTKDNLPTLNRMRSYLRGAFALVFIMGITWLFGLLNTGSNITEVFSILFVVFNGSQGVFIFVFHCLLNDKVKKEYRGLFRKAEWMPDCIRLNCMKLLSESDENDTTQATSTVAFTSRRTNMTGQSAASSSRMEKRGSNFRSSIVEIQPASPMEILEAGIFMGDVGNVYGADDGESFERFIPPSQKPKPKVVHSVDNGGPGSSSGSAVESPNHNAYHGASVDMTQSQKNLANAEEAGGDEANPDPATTAPPTATSTPNDASTAGDDEDKDDSKTDDGEAGAEAPKNVLTILGMFMGDGTEDTKYQGENDD